MVVPVGVSSYYISRIYFLAGLEQTFIRNFNEIAFFGQTAIWGLTVSQIFQYFINYSNDPPILKIFAATLWFLNVAHQLLTTYIVTSLFLNGRIVNIFSKWNLVFFNLSFLFAASLSALSQSFYIGKVWIFASRSEFLKGYKASIFPVILAPFVLFQFVLPFVLMNNTPFFAGVNFYKPSSDVIDRFHLQQNVLMITLAINLGINLVTFSCLASFLRKFYFGAAHLLTFERKTSLMWRASLFTINTGLWNSIFSILSLGAFFILRVNSTYIVLYFHSLSTLYCTGILANLNSRDYMRPVGEHAYLPTPEKRSTPGLTGVEINSIHMQPLDFQRTGTSGKTVTEIISANSLAFAETKDDELSTENK